MLVRLTIRNRSGWGLHDRRCRSGRNEIGGGTVGGGVETTLASAEGVLAFTLIGHVDDGAEGCCAGSADTEDLADARGTIIYIRATHLGGRSACREGVDLVRVAVLSV